MTKSLSTRQIILSIQSQPRKVSLQHQRKSHTHAGDLANSQALTTTTQQNSPTPTTDSVPPDSPTSSSSSSSSPPPSKSHAGAIAGGVVGGVVLLLAIGLGIFWFVLRGRGGWRKKQQGQGRVDIDDDSDYPVPVSPPAMQNRSLTTPSSGLASYPYTHVSHGYTPCSRLSCVSHCATDPGCFVGLASHLTLSHVHQLQWAQFPGQLPIQRLAGHPRWLLWRCRALT